MDERDETHADELDAMNPDLEGAIMDGIEDDPRLGHGVPSHLRGDDLDFIQMSGLTVAGDGEEQPDVPEQDEDLDPSMPVSFYEEGVDDVDSRRAPLGTEPAPGSADDLIVPKRPGGMSSSIASLKEIVADLTGSEGPSPPAAPAESPPEPEEDAGTFEDESADEGYVEDIVVPDDDIEADVPEPEFTDAHSPLRELGPLPEADLDDTPEAPAEPAPEPVPEVPEPASPPEPEPAEAFDTPAAPKAESGADASPPQTGPSEPEGSARRPDLAHAESLLQRLEAQAGAGSEAGDDFEMPEIPEATVPDNEEEGDESVYNRPNTPTRRYNRRRRTRRRLFRLFGALVLLAGLAVGGYVAYDFVSEQTATDAEQYRLAARLIERGQYSEASAAFAAFATRYPDSALRGDALLMAGHAHEQLGEFEEVARLYEQFRREYPDHPKIHRATTLLGLAYVRSGRYEDAIPLLQDPNRRTLDPDGYLASLRALGEAHAALGEIDEARSAYLRAASLEGNYTADEDYLALAGLYQSQARAADDAGTRRRYLGLAVDQWDFAMRSPGITESRRREIKARRDLAISELSRLALSGSAGAPVPGLQDTAEGDPVKPQDGPADDSMEAQSAPDGSVEGQGMAGTAGDEQTQLSHVD